MPDPHGGGKMSGAGRTLKHLVQMPGDEQEFGMMEMKKKKGWILEIIP